jgi:uncharacterized damage-inducible protein DinB
VLNGVGLSERVGRDLRLTRDLLERLPDSAMAWRPHARSFTLAEPHHLIRHRGQLTVYLRLLDVPLTALDGPTADEHS